MLTTHRIWFFIVVPGLLSACDQGAAPDSVSPEIIAAVDKTNPLWKQQLSKPEMMDFTPGEKYYWDMETNM